MGWMLSDLRRSVRRLVHRPTLALTSVVALAIGIGLTSGMFSIVNGLILRGMPFDEPGEILAITRINPSEGSGRLVVRAHDYRAILERQTSFEAIGAIEWVDANLATEGSVPQVVPGARLTAGVLRSLGQSPALGRLFSESDEQADSAPSVLVGDRLWRERLGADPDIVGKTMRVDAREAVVLGVMPPGFEFPFDHQLWLPLQLDYDRIPRGDGPAIQLVGRLADGVSAPQGQADLRRIMEQLAVEYPDTNAGMSVIAAPYVRELIGHQLPSFLFTMLAAVALVLVIACVNVANLLLSRASQRQREIALASALGARRSRLFVQELLDAAVIATLGSLAGLVLAWVGVAQFRSVFGRLQGGTPFWFRVDLDARSAAAVVLTTAVAALLSGALPALQAARADVSQVLKDTSRGSSSRRMGRVTGLLVFAQVAISAALLVGSGLMIRSVSNLARHDYAFGIDSVLTANLSLPSGRYADDDARLAAFDRLVERAEVLPGVRSAAVGTDLPVIGYGNGRFAIDGVAYRQDRDYPAARVAAVGPHYFETLAAVPSSGRVFSADDNSRSVPVAVVNQAFARQYFPDQSAVGQRLSLRATTLGEGSLEREPLRTIVGVVPDMYLDAELFGLTPVAIYVPLAQRPAATAHVVLRTDGDALDVAGALRGAIVEIDGDLPISGVGTLRAAVGDHRAALMMRVFAGSFAIFGAAAVILAIIGLYGVLSNAVSQRRRELGVRVALGATPGGVLGLVVRQGMGRVVAGVGVGLLVAALLGRTLALGLYRVDALDPLVFASIAAILLTAGCVACWIPARRASRVDPLSAMRE